MHDEIEKKLKFLRELERLKGAPVKSASYVSPLEQDINVAKGSAPSPEPVTRIKDATEHIDTKTAKKLISGTDFTSKINALRGLGKKVAGVIPFAGAGMAALSGEPAMAAEELAGDIPVAGQIYEAIKPTESGNPEEQSQMLAENDALKAYKQSPARLDKLRALMGKK